MALSSIVILTIGNIAIHRERHRDSCWFSVVWLPLWSLQDCEVFSVLVFFLHDTHIPEYFLYDAVVGRTFLMFFPRWVWECVRCSWPNCADVTAMFTIAVFIQQLWDFLQSGACILRSACEIWSSAHQSLWCLSCVQAKAKARRPAAPHLKQLLGSHCEDHSVLLPVFRCFLFISSEHHRGLHLIMSRVALACFLHRVHLSFREESCSWHAILS